jgi:hypothetical protein
MIIFPLLTKEIPIWSCFITTLKFIRIVKSHLLSFIFSRIFISILILFPDSFSSSLSFELACDLFLFYFSFLFFKHYSNNFIPNSNSSYLLKNISKVYSFLIFLYALDLFLTCSLIAYALFFIIAKVSRI